MLRILFLIAFISVSAFSQSAAPGGSMALSPARFELEMKPGTETTVVVNLDYRGGSGSTDPVRIVAALNDWTITPDGRVEYAAANTLPMSASPWLVFTPGEAAVIPGTIHQIRVTISVPADAAPGDHLTALVIQQRPEKLNAAQNLRQMIVRYRMASVFYIKVADLTRRGNFENLFAESTPGGLLVRPTFKNTGNSMIRPTAAVKVLNAEGKMVAELPDLEPMPILAGSESNQAVLIDKNLDPGVYTVKYRVDFQDGNKATEGITEVVVRAAQVAAEKNAPKKP